jgi:hypothetical protein
MYRATKGIGIEYTQLTNSNKTTTNSIARDHKDRTERAEAGELEQSMPKRDEKSRPEVGDSERRG